MALNQALNHAHEEDLISDGEENFYNNNPFSDSDEDNDVDNTTDNDEVIIVLNNFDYNIEIFIISLIILSLKCFIKIKYYFRKIF